MLLKLAVSGLCQPGEGVRGRGGDSVVGQRVADGDVKQVRTTRRSECANIWSRRGVSRCGWLDKRLSSRPREVFGEEPYSCVVPNVTAGTMRTV